MFRKAIAKKLEERTPDFRLRGHEIRRIEAFSDAVFGFAVTLLIVSLEVPKSFDELTITMRGFAAFGISFIVLMMIWFEQNIFFRRYGLDDIRTIALNCILIFLVLFYVYPLKFLFTLMFSEQIYGAGHSPFIIKTQDVRKLMMIYGAGYMLIYILFFFMYLHALAKKNILQLTAIEIFETRSQLFKYVILVCIGGVSLIFAQLLPPEQAGFAGFAYMLIGPALSIFYSRRSKQKEKLRKIEIDNVHNFVQNK
ncbi:MAG: DUF1211 domain-containing protein [Chitinophagaceae bacterium]|nr:DUF1211 domain-containing protein [Chitinophagaceae bacterium]